MTIDPNARLGFAGVIRTPEELAEIFGEVERVAREKAIDHLDRHCRAFIARSPFVLVGTSDNATRCDVSPRGGSAGFVEILDDRRLVFAEAKGNRRIDSLKNLLVNPHIGMLFLIPGLGETLRVSGRATIVTDAAVLTRHTEPNREPPKVAVVVEVEEAFLHCAKAFIRSSLWKPAEWPALDGLARPATIWKDHANLIETPEELETLLEETYQAEL